MNRDNPQQAQFETPFDQIDDVNELILAARAAWPEMDLTPAAPMDKDAVEVADDAMMDILSSVLTAWIIMREPVPVDSKERLTQVIDSMIDLLRRIQSILPDDPETLKKDLCHMLRRQLRSQKSSSN